MTDSPTSKNESIHSACAEVIGERNREIERLTRLLNARPPYYCQNCDCASCGNTRPAVETSAPNAQLLERDGFTSLLRDARDAVKRDAKSDCVCGNFSDPDPECKYCRPGRALLARIDAALERLLVESAEQPSATFLLARLGTILNIAEGELTAKAQQDIARLAREVVRPATGLCTACGHGDRYHFDDGKGNVVCRWSLDCHCVHRVESIRPEEPFGKHPGAGDET